MPLPHMIARFNKRVSNRFIEPIARRSSGFAVIHHRGRRSARAYTTPVNLFDLNGDAIVALTYGLSTDWLQNILVNGGTVESRAGCRRIDTARIVDRSVAWPVLPIAVRLALRMLGVTHVLRLTFVVNDAEPST